MNSILRTVGNNLAKHLSKPRGRYEYFSTIPSWELARTLQPCDLILVEGNSRISSAIKYLTQSTWSHVAIYIGQGVEHQGSILNPLLEADLLNGVHTIPLDSYDNLNIRICRPVNISEADQQAVVDFVVRHIGFHYDTKNIFDLMRYLLPTPPVPDRYRRNLIAFGSGDPTKAICSTLVAQAFHSICYPILPRNKNEIIGVTDTESDDVVLRLKHYSHFTPRDFDLSPYFEIIKPTIVNRFDYKKIKWSASPEKLELGCNQE